MKLILFIFYIFLGLIITSNMTAQDFSCISFNIRYDNHKDGLNAWPHRKEAVVNVLKENEPLVFGLQEAKSHQLEYIDSCLNNFAFVGLGRDGGLKGELSPVFYDSARISLIKSSTFWLSETPEEISVGWDADLRRICSYALLEMKDSNRQFWVFNTHFDHVGKIARTESAKLILNSIKRLNSKNLPVILMGDFNATPDETPIKEICKVFFDTFDSDNYTESTFNGFNSKTQPKRIDYIFAKNFTVKSFKIDKEMRSEGLYISDHYPVTATFQFK